MLLCITVGCVLMTDDEVKMTVTLRDYVDKVTDMCNVKIASMSQVEETKQFHCDSDDFRFSKPTIQIKVGTF